MEIRVMYRGSSDEATTEIMSHNVDILPNLGDKAECIAPDDGYDDCKVVERMFDFTQKEVSVKITVEKV